MENKSKHGQVYHKKGTDIKLKVSDIKLNNISVSQTKSDKYSDVEN